MVNGDDEEGDCLSMDAFTSEKKTSQTLNTPIAKSAKSSLLAPDRSRFYTVAVDCSITPSSPAPFSDTQSRSSSREDICDVDEIGDGHKAKTCDGSSSVRVIEVIVQTTATTTRD